MVNDSIKRGLDKIGPIHDHDKGQKQKCKGAIFRIDYA